MNDAFVFPSYIFYFDVKISSYRVLTIKNICIVSTFEIGDSFNNNIPNMKVTLSCTLSYTTKWILMKFDTKNRL